MLKSFKKSKNPADILLDEIDFYPEIVATTIGGDKFNFRINSGTEKSSTNILRIDLSESKKYSLEVEGYSKYDGNKVSGSTYLVTVKEDDSIEKHLLSTDEITIEPIKIDGEKKLPDIDLVKSVINDIWQEAYIDAMDSTNDNDSEPTRKSSKKFNLKSIFIVLFVILIIMISAKALLSFNNKIPQDSEQKITGMYDEISEREQEKTKEGLKTAEQEALAEFGLKEGIKLD